MTDHSPNRTSNRAVEIAGFLEQNGWADALQAPFDADFSPRRYARLVKDDNSRAVLMDADRDQKTDYFVDIDGLLRRMNLSAPEIFAADVDNGLVLMEDFGGRNFGQMLDRGEDAGTLYRRAVDVLVHIHKHFDKAEARNLDLPLFGGALFASQAEMFLDYYFPFARNREATHEEGEAFRAAWRATLRGIEALPQSLMLRDYMPDNLMDLSLKSQRGREGLNATGLLDFQDAGLGPIAYDIASLCEVVRRDPASPGGYAGQVPGDLLETMIGYYIEHAQPGISAAELKNACEILSAQRHMRILGVIARIAAKTGERGKLAYMPRIWKYLDRLLQNPAMKPVQEWVNGYMPR